MSLEKCPGCGREFACALTMADVGPLAGTPEHEQAVRRWARSAWRAWAHAHEAVEAFNAAMFEGSS